MTQKYPPSCVMHMEIIWANRYLNIKGKRAQLQRLNGGRN